MNKDTKSLCGLTPINQIICGDCQIELAKLPDNSIDMLFVDPPYGKDGIYLYEAISKEAARVLKDGKFAVFYASDYWMPETFIPCCKYLNYFYLFHVLNNGAHASIFPRKLFGGAKSILVFSKEKPKPNKWTNNIVPITKREKSHRKDNWEQAVGQAEFFIDVYSNEGDIILDCVCGSGTTLVAAKQLNRNYIGIDISPEQCEVAKQRIAELKEGIKI